MKDRIIKKNNKSFNVTITKNISYWEKLEKGNWEPNTFKIFDNFIASDTIFLDIGAWIGQTALYACQFAAHTYAFEPDPIAFEELNNNVNINTNAEWASKLTIYNKAIGITNGTIKIGSRGQGGDSMSSALFSNQKTNWEVEAISLESFIEDQKLQNKKLFIKIDIEGGEYNLIPKLKTALSKCNIVLFLSMHTFFLMNSLKSNENKENSIKKIIRRIHFFWYHVKLVQALKFKYYYLNNGKEIKLNKILLKTFFQGKFPSEIVATNIKWEKT